MKNREVSKYDLLNFENHASSSIGEWHSLLCQKEYDKANELCEIFINIYKPVYNQKEMGESQEEYHNSLLVILVLFKLLQDFAILLQITQDKTWHSNNKIVELVWIKLCDCKDRIEFCIQYYDIEIIELVLNSLYKLESFFRDVYGNGMYNSPGLLIDKLVCNICNKDARGCPHIEGRIYNGTICHYQPVNVQCDHIALVKVPKDPRCRIWPWQSQDNPNGEGIILETCVLTNFMIDDFLYN